MSTPDDELGPLHSMGVVCRKTGLKSDRVRAWERRYDVVEPIRTDGNHRLYRDADIDRLRLLRIATEAGHRIAQIARLPTEELRALVEDDQATGERPKLGPADEAAAASALVGSCLSAVQQLDADRLRSDLRQAFDELRPVAVTQLLLVPLIHEIGELWAEGGLKASHEHLGTAVLRTFIEELRSVRPVAADAPRLLMTTPAGERHELGALLATATATDAGWHVTYLGPDLPAADIAAAARQKGARAIGLSVVCPQDAERVRSELETLRRHAGERTGLIVGGRGAQELEETASMINAVIVEDLVGLPPALALFA